MENLEVSKELLSEVLGIKVSKLVTDSWLNAHNNIVFEEKDSNFADFINVYEFAFKCKEWAFKRELNLWTDYLGNCQIQDKDFQLLNDCYYDTEIEAIIKACEWILSEENK